MSAIETLIKTVLNHLDLDVEVLKEQVTSRIKAFETNVETLNATLIAHHKSLARIEDAIARVEAQISTIDIFASADERKPNGTGNALPPPVRPDETS